MISSIGISSANTRSVSDTALALPSVQSTILGWFRPLVLGVQTRRVVAGEVKYTTQRKNCRGVIQPFAPQELVIKPEGERSWDWKHLYTTPDVQLVNGQTFFIKGTPYRVMSTIDYSEYGYVGYELVQNYEPTPTLTDE